MTTIYYLGTMDTKNQVSNGQGSEEANLENIEKWLDQDLSRLLSLINAMYQDKELKKLLVQWFHGRMLNERNKKAQAEAMKNQSSIPFPAA